MLRPQSHFPSPPQIGLPESHYANLARIADKRGDTFAREAAKVGQYITLALDAHLDWPSKRRYFEHALRRHCIPPPLPDEQVWLFFKSLADVVKHHAGQEALRLAAAEDDHYLYLKTSGLPRAVMAAKAEGFFDMLMGRGNQRHEIFTEEDWDQLRLIRAQWM